MKTVFHAASAVSADKVSHLLSNEFCMRHGIDHWNGTGDAGRYTSVDLTHRRPLLSDVINKLTVIGLTKAPR